MYIDKLREQDMEELKDKEENHKNIMTIDNNDEWELYKGLYRKVLERIQNKRIQNKRIQNKNKGQIKLNLLKQGFKQKNLKISGIFH